MSTFVLASCLLGFACKDTARPPIESPADVGVEDGIGGSPNDGAISSPDAIVQDPKTPRVLFDRGSQGPKALHASERHLFWYESNIAEGARIFGAPKDGSRGPEVLAAVESLGAYSFIASDEEHVYWVQTDSIVRRRHGQEASTETFPLGRSFLYPFLARDGNDLYVTDLGCFLIARISMVTFDVTILREEQNAAEGGASVIATDGSDVFCSTGHLGTVIAINKNGGPVREVVRTEDGYGIAGIALGDRQMFFVRVPRSLGQAGQIVMQVPLAGGEPRELARVEVRGGGSQLFYDTAHAALYWIDVISQNGGNLHRLDVATGAVNTVVHTKLNAHLTMDQERLYYVQVDPGAIYAVDLY